MQSHSWRLLLGGFGFGVVATTAGMAFAQRAGIPDALLAAPDHYTLEFENENVRVIRVKYGAHTKSALHQHSGDPTVFVALTAGGPITQTTADGAVTNGPVWEAGRVRYAPRRPVLAHRVENLGDKAFEEIRVELKSAR